MPVATHVPLTPSVLAWAVDELGLGEETIAERTGVGRHQVAVWIAGEQQPTRGEFSRLVDVLRRPSALFFLPQPPPPQAAAIAFRGPTQRDRQGLTAIERRRILEARRFQDLLHWIREQSSRPGPMLPAIPGDVLPEAAAALVRTWTGIMVDAQLHWTSSQSAFDAWRQAIEQQGILVFLYELSRDGVRAFSLPDTWAPVIGLNTAFNPEARTFSLMHELGHLVTGIASACIGFSGPRHHGDETERWCETFAADLLLPAATVRERVRSRGLPTRTVDAARRAVTTLSRDFRVSQRAMALRLIDLDLAPGALYARIAREAQLVDFPKEQRGGNGQGRPERRIARLGRRVPRIVLDAADRGLITYRDALDYLEVDTGEAAEIEELLGASK